MTHYLAAFSPYARDAVDYSIDVHTINGHTFAQLYSASGQIVMQTDDLPLLRRFVRMLRARGMRREQRECFHCDELFTPRDASCDECLAMPCCRKGGAS